MLCAGSGEENSTHYGYTALWIAGPRSKVIIGLAGMKTHSSFIKNVYFVNKTEKRM